MIWFAIPVAVALAILLLAWALDKTDVIEYRWYDWETAQVTWITCVCMLFISMMLTVAGATTDDNVTQFDADLRAIAVRREVGKVSGSFFLGCGSISTEGGGPRFWFYREFDEGVILRSVSVDRAVVVEEEVEQPFVRMYIDGETRWDWTWGVVRGGRARRRCWEFHVPVGSVAPVVDLGLGG